MRSDPLTLAVFVMVVLIGGTNFVAVRFSNQELAPFWGAGTRFAVAAFLLLCVAVGRGLQLPRGRALLGAGTFGVLNFGVSYALAYWALVEAPAALASVVVALVPLLTLLLARLHGLEQLSWRGAFGGGIALVGIAIVFADQLQAAIPLASVMALIIMAVCIAESTVIAKILPRVHPIATNGVAMVPGAALLLLLSAIVGEDHILPMHGATWFAFTYLATIGSVGLFVGFLLVVQRWSASATSYATVLFPIVTVAIGALVAREIVSLTFVIGAAVLVMVGAYLGATAASSPQAVEVAARRGAGD